MSKAFEMSDACSNCGGQVPRGARFCPHCGALQVGDDAPGAAEAASPTPGWSWCEIEWVRSFRGSEFQTRPLSPDATQELLRSPTFRWRANEPPPETHADAREAHEALVTQLVVEDWEPIGDAGPWYAGQFRRPMAESPSQTPAPPAVSEAPPARSLPAESDELRPPAPAPAPARALERPPTQEMLGERVGASLPARIGIGIVTVISVVIIIVVILVALGFFRGNGANAKAGSLPGTVLSQGEGGS